MKSNGIIILVSGRGSYGANSGIYATEFVKSIVKQKSGDKNSIGGYSMSGPAAGEAANEGDYDRLIIFDSYFRYVNNYNNLKKKEVVIYSPVGDAMLQKTLELLADLKNSNYENITIVSNNTNIVNKYSSNFLIINPGNPMGSGHGYVNITNAKVFSYACS